ncbi:MAG TPA: DUF5681 domain-containing protein [Candidatus Paceibacterota bacterium]
MAENSKKQPRGKPFAKGQTGNPGGRPKRTQEEINLIDACKDKTEAALAVIEGLMQDAKSDAVKLSAAMAIIERAWGKPVQPTDNQHSGGITFTWQG